MALPGAPIRPESTHLLTDGGGTQMPMNTTSPRRRQTARAAPRHSSLGPGQIDVHALLVRGRAQLEDSWRRIGPPLDQALGARASSGRCLPACVALRRLFDAELPTLGPWRVAGGMPRAALVRRLGAPANSLAAASPLLEADGGFLTGRGGLADHRWLVSGDGCGFIADATADQFDGEPTLVGTRADRRWRENLAPPAAPGDGRRVHAADRTPRPEETPVLDRTQLDRRLAHPDAEAALLRLRRVAAAGVPRFVSLAVLLEEGSGGQVVVCLDDGRVLEIDPDGQLVAVDGAPQRDSRGRCFGVSAVAARPLVDATRALALALVRDTLGIEPGAAGAGAERARHYDCVARATGAR